MYKIRPYPPKDISKSLEKYHPVAQKLLFNRGIKTSTDAENFFNRDWSVLNVHEYKELNKATERIIEACLNKEKVGIYSDYDCDGIPAAAILYCTLKALGLENVFHYVPQRNRDGFGINETGIKYMKDNDVSLIIVLDCGTSDFEGVKKLTDVAETIVVDHHLPSEKIPECFAMVNPIIDKIESSHPCTAGLVYLLAQEIVKASQGRKLNKLPIGWEKWQLDLVCIATISDMVPLRETNRQFVYYGLKVLQKTPRPGFQALFKLSKINQKKINYEDISFKIIPKINAASRMSEAGLAFELFTTSSYSRAEELVKKLTTLNNKRRIEVANMVKKANKEATTKQKTNSEIWVLGDRVWKPSLVGLVAQKISENYNKTVFVWGQSEMGEVKGSFRSTNHNFDDLKLASKDLVKDFGGHSQAGGFSLKKGAELELEDVLNKEVEGKLDRDNFLMVDEEVSLKNIKEILKITENFSPFGMQNEALKIAITNFQLDKIISFGKNREHKKYRLKDGDYFAEAISFFDNNTNTEIKTIIGFVDKDLYTDRAIIRVDKIF